MGQALWAGGDGGGDAGVGSGVPLEAVVTVPEGAGGEALLLELTYTRAACAGVSEIRTEGASLLAITSLPNSDLKYIKPFWRTSPA